MCGHWLGGEQEKLIEDALTSEPGWGWLAPIAASVVRLQWTWIIGHRRPAVADRNEGKG